MKLTKPFLIICTLLCATSFAKGSRGLKFEAGTSFSNANLIFNGAPQNSTRLMDYGFGVFFDYPFTAAVKRFALEIGVEYMGRTYSANSPAGTLTTYSFKYIEIPVMAHVGLGEHFDFELGGYVAFPFGTPTTSVAAGGGATTETPTTFQTLNYDTLDIGIAGGVGFSYPLGPNADLVLDGRLLFGVNNANLVPGALLNFRTIEILAGIKIGI